MSSSSLNDHERVGVVGRANVVRLDACESPVCVGGVEGFPDSIPKICRACNRRKENVNDARSFALLITAGSRHDVGHILGVSVRLVVLRSRDACLIHLLGDGIVRNVSVIVVDLLKEERGTSVVVLVMMIGREEEEEKNKKKHHRQSGQCDNKKGSILTWPQKRTSTLPASRTG